MALLSMEVNVESMKILLIMPGLDHVSNVTGGGSLSGGWGLCPGGASVRETPCTVKSGWYTFYWNAFLSEG